MCCYGFSADALAPPSSQQRQEEGRREEAQRTSEQDSLKDALARNLPADPQAEHDLEAAWSSFRDRVYNTAMSVLGHPRKKHQDWFDESNQEMLGLLADKRAAFAA